MGGARRPGPLGMDVAVAAVGSLLSAPGAPGAAATVRAALTGDSVRLQLLEIRRRMRELIKGVQLPADGVILYSGTRAALDDFSRFLVRQKLARETVYIEQTEAGRYLEQQSQGVLANLLAPGGGDWNQRVGFQDGDGATFSASLMGFWRELSARFAKAASGNVHVLLPPGRRDIPETAASFWTARLQHGAIEGLEAKDFLADLRTFGFVEFPILYGLISTNASVRTIKLYEWKGGESFDFVRDVRR